MNIRHKLYKKVVIGYKLNRNVLLNEEDKKQGCSQPIDTVDFLKEKPIKGWIAAVDFPVLLFRQVFKNKDGSQGILYGVCSDPECDAEALKATRGKRGKVEVFHKTLKSNTAMAKSPGHTVLTQSNPLFMSIDSAFRLEVLANKRHLNHFEWRVKLYLSAQNHHSRHFSP